MFNKYYQDELIFLRETGREFAQANPEAARFLAESSADPDVERTLEGVAFLTARLRQKLDDEIPEFTHALTEMFWPHYLRPMPSATIMQFHPSESAAAAVTTVPKGFEVSSAPVSETPCKFATTADSDVVPLKVAEVSLQREIPESLIIKLQTVGRAQLGSLELSKLRFYLSGENMVTRSLLLAMTRFTETLTVRSSDGSQSFKLQQSAIQPAGFAEENAFPSGPGPQFPAFRLLREYFAVPQKFMFIDIDGLEGIKNFNGQNEFELEFSFKSLPKNMPPVSAANLLLNCAPALNMFKHDADPIRLDKRRNEYRIRPSGKEPSHFEVFSINRVYGLEQGTAREIEYRAQFNVARNGKESGYYHVRHQKSEDTDKQRLFIEFLDPPKHTDKPDVETLTVELTCTNGELPTRLAIGDIETKAGKSSGFETAQNISKPTPPVEAPLFKDSLWRLTGHICLNYSSLMSVQALRNVVNLYNFRAQNDRQAWQAHQRLLEGISAIDAQPATCMFEGAPIRGLDIALELDEELLGGEGEMYLFASILNELFAQAVSMNSYSRLTVRGTKFGGTYEWPARLGNRTVL